MRAVFSISAKKSARRKTASLRPPAEIAVGKVANARVARDAVIADAVIKVIKVVIC